MATQQAELLTTYGQRLIEILAKAGLVAKLDPESFRDWTAKLRVSGGPLLKAECVNLYANSKGKTSFKLHEATPTSRPLLESGLNGQPLLPMAATSPSPAASYTPPDPSRPIKAAELEEFCIGLIVRLRARGINARIDDDSYRDWSVKLDIAEGSNPPTPITITTNSKGVFQGRYDQVPTERKEFIRMTVDTAIANLPDGIVAFVDGSYKKETNRGGYGVRVINSGRIVFDLAGPVENPQGDNIAGEIRGVLRVFDWARASGAKKVQIRHDYEGLKFWHEPDPRTGKLWKTNSDDARMYVGKIAAHKTAGLELDFVKVPAHAGDIHNEAVDQLAKEGVTLSAERITRYKPLTLGSPSPSLVKPSPAPQPAM